MWTNACSMEVWQDVLGIPSSLVELQTFHYPCITCSITLLLHSTALSLFGLEAQIWPRVDLGVSLISTSMSDLSIFWKGIWHLLSDSRSARAMPRNAVNLPVPLPRGSLTVEACVTACGNAGQFFTLLICISFQLLSQIQATPLLGLSMQTSVVRAFEIRVRSLTIYLFTQLFNRLRACHWIEQSTYHWHGLFTPSKFCRRKGHSHGVQRES